MCLGLPGRVLAQRPGSAVAEVEVAGVSRDIDVSILAGPVGPGDYLLVHSGIAIQRMTDEESRDALASLGIDLPVET